ncbi:unnamed protein product [Effrenium voratum]|nr:unnamed protein product [Effrenium voratum]
MVDAERRTVVALKQQQAEMMQQRTELEVLLRQCLDDVKAEVLRTRMHEEGKDPVGPPAPLSSVPTAQWKLSGPAAISESLPTGDAGASCFSSLAECRRRRRVRLAWGHHPL